MHYQTKYQVDEKLVTLSAKQVFHNIYLKKRWILILGFFIFPGLVMAFPNAPEDGHMTIVYVTLSIGTILAATWIKAYYAMLSNTRSAFNATGGGMMEVNIDDEIISLSSAAGSRNIPMEKITSVIETKDFLVLLADKTPLFTPLKSALTPEIITYLLNHKLG